MKCNENNCLKVILLRNSDCPTILMKKNTLSQVNHFCLENAVIYFFFLSVTAEKRSYDNGSDGLVLLLLTKYSHLLHFVTQQTLLSHLYGIELYVTKLAFGNNITNLEIYFWHWPWVKTSKKLSKISLMYQVTAFLVPSSIAVVAQITRAVNSPILCLCTSKDHVHEKSTEFLSSLWKTPSRMECADSFGFSGRSHIWTSLTESSVRHSRFP